MGHDKLPNSNKTFGNFHVYHMLWKLPMFQTFSDLMTAMITITVTNYELDWNSRGVLLGCIVFHIIPYRCKFEIWYDTTMYYLYAQIHAPTNTVSSLVFFSFPVFLRVFIIFVHSFDCPSIWCQHLLIAWQLQCLRAWGATRSPEMRRANLK